MAILILIIIGCLGQGTMNDIKATQVKEICARQRIPNAVPEYNLLIVLMTGLAAIVAFITAIMRMYPVAAVALIASVLIPFRYILEAIKMVPVMKKAGWGSGGMLHFQPYWIWARIVLLGMGKWIHILMCCTLVGIPLYNMMKTVSVNMDALTEQIELRKEYERLHK